MRSTQITESTLLYLSQWMKLLITICKIRRLMVGSRERQPACRVDDPVGTGRSRETGDENHSSGEEDGGGEGKNAERRVERVDSKAVVIC